jgi:DnaK suppressor protein
MTNADDENPSGLTPAQLQILRERLERLRETLLARLQREQEVVREAEPLYEPLEAAEQTREQDDAILFTEHDRALLGEIEHALAKFETGRYGVSERSGEPIGFQRLLAVPWARVTADEMDDTDEMENSDEPPERR